MLNRNNCLICQEELVYENESRPMTCRFCQGVFESNASCKAGHFICDACHSQDAIQVITSYCLNNESADPVGLANSIMKHPAIKMHGPEHHYLVPAVLLSCYASATQSSTELVKQLEQARKRSGNILGGFCGFCGNCGAAVGTGIFLSVITHTKPTSEKHWGNANRITANSLLRIADVGGPRCCKRDTFIALKQAVEFMKATYDVSMHLPDRIVCTFSHLNKECKKEKCQFYRKPNETYKGT
jgi:hypothetical protein